MPIQLEVRDNSDSIIGRQVILPKGLLCIIDISTGQPDFLMFHCDGQDRWQSIFQLTEEDGLEASSGDVLVTKPLTLDTAQALNSADGVEANQDSEYHTEIVTFDGRLAQVSAYFLGGLAAHYAVSTEDRVSHFRFREGPDAQSDII